MTLLDRIPPTLIAPGITPSSFAAHQYVLCLLAALITLCSEERARNAFGVIGFALLSISVYLS